MQFSKEMKSSSVGDSHPVSSPPLPPRTYLPLRKQDQLFDYVPPPASATGYPVPVPRTSIKKHADSPVRSPSPAESPDVSSSTDRPACPPVRSVSSPMFTANSHYWSLAEVAVKTCLHCRCLPLHYCDIICLQY